MNVAVKGRARRRVVTKADKDEGIRCKSMAHPAQPESSQCVEGSVRYGVLLYSAPAGSLDCEFQV